MLLSRCRLSWHRAISGNAATRAVNTVATTTMTTVSATTPSASATYTTPSTPVVASNLSVNSAPLPRTWFQPSVQRPNILGASNDHKPFDERTLRLGKTLRILQDRLPTLLHSPLPTEILSPHITLHLFPSTHPDLPTVRGRVAYIAALWTAPVAWGRLPGGSSTKLEVMSERMLPSEVLKVRWRAGGSPDGTRDVFWGIFTFAFDEEGRIVKHVIENVEDGQEEERGNRVGSVITVTEWLMRKARGGREGAGEEGGLAWQCERIRYGDGEEDERGQGRKEKLTLM